jgi:hypothetical protein
MKTTKQIYNYVNANMDFTDKIIWEKKWFSEEEIREAIKQSINAEDMIYKTQFLKQLGLKA